MSLEKLDQIDLVAELPGSNAISLIAFDTGEILDVSEREAALQKKLHGYLQFIVSGQFARMHPEHANREKNIQVVCMAPPTERMRAVKGIRDHDNPEVFFSVEVMSEEEFHASLERGSPPSQKS
jgi:hypothetical protein